MSSMEDLNIQWELKEYRKLSAIKMFKIERFQLSIQTHSITLIWSDSLFLFIIK